MKKHDSKGDKLNKVAVGAAGAVRTGFRKISAAAAGACRRMRLWQKAGLLICVLFWIISYVISIVCGRITGAMKDQNYASRWALEGGCSQVSAYFSDMALLSDESVDAIKSNISNKLMEASLGLSEQQIENGARLFDTSYSGIGMAEISTPSDSVTVTAIGVGGSFFNFHPLKLMSGYYFSEDESMKDRILLDDRTAWRLFGSPDIVGESVDIAGTPHYIAGVFRAPSERFYKQSGMGDYLIYVSYDSLCKYTEKGTPESDKDSKDTDDSMLDALAPLQKKQASGQEGADEGLVEAPASLQGRISSGRTLAFLKNVVLPAAYPRLTWKQDENQPLHSGVDREKLPAFDSVDDLADQDADSGAEGSEEGTEKSTDSEGSDKDTDKDTIDDDDPTITGDDAPVGESLNGSGMSGNYYSGTSDNVEKAEVNRARISCYEAVLPDPITHFALNTLNSCLTESGVDNGQRVIVQNTDRYDSPRLALMMAQPGLRSMQSVAIRYPYWENVARAWEDVLIPFAFLELFMRFSPFLFLLFLLLWYATHRNWTVGGWIQKTREKIYDRQSEKIYGSSADEDRLEGRRADAEDRLTGAETEAGKPFEEADSEDRLTDADAEDRLTGEDTEAVNFCEEDAEDRRIYAETEAGKPFEETDSEDLLTEADTKDYLTEADAEAGQSFAEADVEDRPVYADTEAGKPFEEAESEDLLTEADTEDFLTEADAETGTPLADFPVNKKI